MTTFIRTILNLMSISIYKFARICYKVFYTISTVTLVNEDLVSRFSSKIFSVLSIFMIFVLSFNLLKYIVNPDKMMDKSEGVTSILKNTVLALIIITLAPSLFTKLYSVQNTIITSGIIPAIVFGSDTNSQGTGMDNAASVMIINTFTAFFTPDDPEFSAFDCGDTTSYSYTTYTDYCDDYEKAKIDGKISHFNDIISDKKYEYSFIAPFAGIALAYFMLAYCLDMATRAGKLAILELIAPIPALLEILPNKKGTRKKWVDMLISTYLDVFIFQATVFVIMYLTSYIPDILRNFFGGFLSEIGPTRIIAYILLCFGLFKFGLEAPKLVSELLGLKSAGSFGKTFNRGLAMFGVGTGLAASSLGRGLRNGVATYRAAGGGPAGFGKGLLSAGAGVTSGVGRTLWQSRNVHKFGDGMKLRTSVNQQLTTARVNRSAYNHAHGSIFSVKGSKYRLQEMVRGAASGIYGYTNWIPGSSPNSTATYERIKRADAVSKEFKKLYTDNITSIYKNDSKYSSLANAEASAKEALNLGKSFSYGGFTYYANASDVPMVPVDKDDPTKGTKPAENCGLLSDFIADAEAKKIDRRNEVLKDNKDKFMEGAGILNNFIDSHQGEAGVTKERIKLEDIGNIGTAADAGDQLKNLDNLVQKDGTGVEYKDSEGTSYSDAGWKTVSDSVKGDTAYQQRRIEDKLAEDARQQTRKAANDANNAGKK